jgi:predicted metalloendopeptidase
MKTKKRGHRHIKRNQTEKIKKSVEEQYETKFKKNIEKQSSNIQQSLIKMFNKPFSPSHITPRSDFYTYINYLWLTGTRQEKIKNQYYVQIDDFRVTQDKVYRQLVEIVETFTKKDHSRKARLIENVYRSMLGLNDGTTKKHIAETLRANRVRLKEDDLWKFLAHVNENQIVSWASPISWKVQADSKNSKVYRDYIVFPQFSLYDADLYFDDNTGKTAEYATFSRLCITYD